jgi:hypothetical protein
MLITANDCDNVIEWSGNLGLAWGANLQVKIRFTSVQSLSSRIPIVDSDWKHFATVPWVTKEQEANVPAFTALQISFNSYKVISRYPK